MTERGYLLDIEGTTTPVDFVHRVLFPFARNAMSEYLNSNATDPSLVEDAASLFLDYQTESEAPAGWDGSVMSAGFLDYLYFLMDHDKKSTGLKAIQGRIWAEGYSDGRLVSEIYDDVEPAIRCWKSAGAKVCIFSSGSVEAQKLLFGHLRSGSILHLLDGYFDTTIGPKRDASSYQRIANEMQLPLGDVLFLSDTPQEIEAAQTAGMNAVLVDRNAASPNYPAYICSFADLSI